MAKDLFSAHSGLYARYRPDYPAGLFDYLSSLVENKELAWDCATGNGQAAKVLSEHFKFVEATDISASQLDNAIKKPNIRYQVCAAENTPFADNSFDLITVAQAYHWFRWEEFRKEAIRVGKNGTVVAVWTYNVLISEDEKINRIVQHFYKDITGPYWDSARRFVEEEYATLPFDFDPLPLKKFEIRLQWNKEDFKGYLTTWSAFQQYLKQNGASPLPLIEKDIDNAWAEMDSKSFHFPITLRSGRIRK